MARGVNKVILVGNLGKEPETRYMPNGDAVTNIALATSDTWKDKQTGQPQERTEWHRVVFFGRLAEVVGEYLKKGSKVYVEGSLRTRKWQAQDGQDRYTTEIVASEMQMLDSRGGGVPHPAESAPAAPPHGSQQNSQQSPQQNSQPQGQQNSQLSAGQQRPPGGGQGMPQPPASNHPFDDDIPF